MASPRFYSAAELTGLTKADLELIADARGVDVTATGKDHAVLVGDLVKAISAAQDATGINPALVAEPVVATKRWYRVTAPTEVFEQRPGSEFERVIEEQQERLLLQSGAIVRIPAKEGE